MHVLKIFVYLEKHSWAYVLGNDWAQGRMADDEVGEIDKAYIMENFRRKQLPFL